MRIKQIRPAGLLLILCLGAYPYQALTQAVKTTTKFATGANVYQPVYNPVEDVVYVSGAKDLTNHGVIYKLDGRTLQLIDSIAIPASAPMGLGINVKTQTLYSTNSRTALVTAIDIKTGKQTHISAAVPNPHAREVIVDEDRNIIYVTNVRTGGIWVIDGHTNTFVRYIYNLGRAVTGAALDMEGNQLYATAMADNQVVIADPATGFVLKKFEAHGQRPTNVYFDKSGNRLFIANQTTGNITVLDAETGDLIKAISTGKGALGVDYDTQHNRIYVANRHGRTVSVIDGTTLEVVKTFDMEGLPNTFAINPHNGVVYVTNKAAVDEKDEQGNTFRREARNGDSVSMIVP